MITRPENLFVEGFVAALKSLGVERISFRDGAYTEGLLRVQKLVEVHSKDIPSLTLISILFVRRPPDGEFVRFNTAILNLHNTKRCCCTGGLKFTVKTHQVDHTLDERCGYPREFMINVAKEFLSSEL